MLDGCVTVEDWGCGPGTLRGYLPDDVRYVGVDSSASPAADVRADLRTYRGGADGVILRHVLEHNDEWRAVLAHANAAAREVLAVVLFTPLQLRTRVLLREPDYGNVPVIGFRLGDLLASVRREADVETVVSPSTFYGEETFIRWA